MKKNLNDKRKHKKRRRRDPAAGAMLAVGLPMETDGSTAKVTMLGHRLALIENHRGVYAYTEKGITLTGPEGMLSVYVWKRFGNKGAGQGADAGRGVHYRSDL